MTTQTHYSRLQIGLHWLIALLILAAWISGDGMGKALRERVQQDMTGLDGATPHTILGGTIFALVLWRIVVRLMRGAPEPTGTPSIQRAAVWGHRLLYATMVLVPALGAITWYGKVSALGDVHAVAGNALLIIALGHVGMAIWHHFVLKDGTLDRMRKPAGSR